MEEYAHFVKKKKKENFQELSVSHFCKKKNIFAYILYILER